MGRSQDPRERLNEIIKFELNRLAFGTFHKPADCPLATSLENTPFGRCIEINIAFCGDTLDIIATIKHVMTHYCIEAFRAGYECRDKEIEIDDLKRLFSKETL